MVHAEVVDDKGSDSSVVKKRNRFSVGPWWRQRIKNHAQGRSVPASKVDVLHIFQHAAVTQDVKTFLEVAESGSVKEFERLYLEDPSRLRYHDCRGQTPLHRAASRNQVSILQFILDHGGDANERDNEGNTALHLAVEHDSLEALSFLLDHGADPNLLNNDLQGPIHLATELNKVRILEEMVKHKQKLSPVLRGKHGRTALHIAAIYDHVECAKILLNQMSVCPKVCCDNGYYAIHEAAKNGSANTLEAILNFGISMGYQRESLMMLYDADGNVPLHSAVHAGDIKAVRLCLESGAKISTQQRDLSTPVHLACAQGAIEIVRLMFQSQPEEKALCLSIGDAQEMTPLHCAAMFDRRELVEYLIQEGADPSRRDKEGRTVLLLAAARSAWDTLSALLRLYTSNIADTDANDRNLLHHIVISGGNLDIFTQLISQKRSSCLVTMLNERDSLGCTPMHYASRTGHLRTIQSLLRLGAAINLKDNENQSPLHFAARYGRYNTVRHLLDNTKGHLIINEMDGEGRTPLHIASQNGHTRVVQLLLIRGALLNRDHRGRTPLHYAAMNGYTHTMEQLLAVHSHLLDQTDREGNTALHLAACNNRGNVASLLLTLNCQLLRNARDQSAVDCALFYKHSEVTMAMVTHVTRSDDIMKCKLKQYGSLLEALTAIMPDVMMVVLDRGITKSKFSEDSKSYYIKYNFEYLQDTGKICAVEPKEPAPLPVMNLMVKYGREELMSHPLCVKYLESKWSSYGLYFHLANLAVYTIFLIFITSTALLMNFKMASNSSNATIANTLLLGDIDEFFPAPTYSILQMEAGQLSCTTSVVVLVFVILNAFKEFYQMAQQRGKYFADPMNLMEWLLYLSAGTMAISHLFPDCMDPSCVYIAAAMAVFFAWFNYLLYLQRFYRVGLYIVMFLEILSTLLKVVLVFSVLFIAFGLSFYILLATVEGLGEKGFYSAPISLLRVATMMLGEIDFLGTFLRPLRTSSAAFYQMAAAMWFLVIFAIFMPILLMNLLIGLAVGDIETVRRNAQMKRLTMQVELHTDLERKLPAPLIKMVDKMEVLVYPNKKGSSSYMWTTIQSWFTNPRDEVTLEPPRVGEPSEDLDDHGFDIGHPKKHLKEIGKMLEQQLHLLRLIVKKMEISSENEDIDEGEYLLQERPLTAHLTTPNSARAISPRSNRN